VLVLSENAGAHEELGEWCLSVNPVDVWGQAEALHEALTMGEAERHRRLTAIQAQVRAHDVRAWIDALLADLDDVTAYASADD
jgi:trehalose 6-phosphate synthase